MKKALIKSDDPDLLEEYDFSRGIRSKYSDRYKEGCNVVLLDLEVAEIFTDSESVNRALGILAEMIRRKIPKA